jgi:hypothetical protein
MKSYDLRIYDLRSCRKTRLLQYRQSVFALVRFVDDDTEWRDEFFS